MIYMAKHIENVVIGKASCNLYDLFALNESDWIDVEQEKTLFTDERYLPKILVDCGIVKSTSEVKRNKPQFNIILDKKDFITVKWGKKKLWICVGE